ncbi:hypothetical protein Afil01_61740 [Actinorhabdospora filicis]|uniref:Uncharacterized protein n=1 Tax=Actinorhabdospora filicis TaxID=1785913 RepID=A0A9W6W6B9_9ACTN|nr:hypothetical protein Afil01_61740 [Actinorhabdospora filicis]
MRRRSDTRFLAWNVGSRPTRADRPRAAELFPSGGIASGSCGKPVAHLGHGLPRDTAPYKRYGEPVGA